MTFLPLKPCCLEGLTLPGDPKGVMEGPSDTRSILRYHAKPQNGQVVDEKAAVVLFYDAMGFKMPNPKIMADQFAERLGIHVFVPDYIPNPPDPIAIDRVLPSYPGEPLNKNKSYLSIVKDYAVLAWNIIWVISGILESSVCPLAEKAVAEVKADGFEKIGAIGRALLRYDLPAGILILLRYCRGGLMVMHLLALPNSPIDCGVPAHPSPDPKRYLSIQNPSSWHLAEEDTFFSPAKVQELRDIMGKKEKEEGVVFGCNVYPDTAHGFAARPNLGHEPTREAFQLANDRSIGFFKKYLKLGS